METNETKLNTLHQKRESIEKGGGEKRIQKQHKSGKLTARERIQQLLDKDSFIEIDAFVEHRSIQFDMQ
ncbi:MAG: carboxyl transferase domain-containing protein, partial [Tepidanaerobacteraceae bacterium]|nr:carboxyl transferase domain-containing protein [Tepidanaerobacteraceae bacterium]